VSAKYLLPCSSCGEKMSVEVPQAGQQIKCDCGADLEVPTMAGIKALQRANPSPGDQRPISRWEARHGVLLVGVVIIIAGVCITVDFHRGRPQMMKMEELNPFQTWMVWEFLKQGVRRPSFENNPSQMYQEALKTHKMWMAGCLSIVVLGFLVSVASALVPKRRLKRRIVKIPVQESRPPPAEPPPDVSDT
jgi:hypothetical protein